jgi:hypothetical protein
MPERRTWEGKRRTLSLAQVTTPNATIRIGSVGNVTNDEEAPDRPSATRGSRFRRDAE